MLSTYKVEYIAQTTVAKGLFKYKGKLVTNSLARSGVDNPGGFSKAVTVPAGAVLGRGRFLARGVKSLLLAKVPFKVT